MLMSGILPGYLDLLFGESKTSTKAWILAMPIIQAVAAMMQHFPESGHISKPELSGKMHILGLITDVLKCVEARATALSHQMILLEDAYVIKTTSSLIQLVGSTLRGVDLISRTTGLGLASRQIITHFRKFTVAIATFVLPGQEVVSAECFPESTLTKNMLEFSNEATARSFASKSLKQLLDENWNLDDDSGQVVVKASGRKVRLTPNLRPREEETDCLVEAIESFHYSLDMMPGLCISEY